jgi:tyrosyl-tRNA synthetase
MGERNDNRYIAKVMAGLNETEGIWPTSEELRGHMSNAHLLVADGRSNDRTVEIAQDKSETVLIKVRAGKEQVLHQSLGQ